MNNIKELVDKLTNKIQSSYEEDITVKEAEKLAAEFLHAQLLITNELTILELDARMRKSGYKAVTATIYMENATKTEKKPSDMMLQHQVELSELVRSEKDNLDTSEVKRDELQNYLNIFKEAHIYYRGIAKGFIG